MLIDIYCISDMNDNVIYVGKTIVYNRRKSRHRDNFKNGCTFPLYKHMRKISSDVKRDFKFTIIQTCMFHDVAKADERYWIKYYKPIGNKQIPN